MLNYQRVLADMSKLIDLSELNGIDIQPVEVQDFSCTGEGIALGLLYFWSARLKALVDTELVFLCFSAVVCRISA